MWESPRAPWTGGGFGKPGGVVKEHLRSSNSCRREEARAANEGTFICIRARKPTANANEGPRSAGERADDIGAGTRALRDLPLLLVSFLSPMFVPGGCCEAGLAAVRML